MTIKEEISAGLGIYIADWDMAFNTLDRRGQVTTRVLIELFLVLAKRLEKLEQDQPLPVTLENVTPTVQVGQPTADRGGEETGSPAL